MAHTPRPNGGYAFPTQTETEWFYGMTLRDYFAAKALMGLLASYTDDTSYPGESWAATTAYEMADAMLAERSKVAKAEGRSL